MKKVRIMLMAICLVTVTGGLVAFKTMIPEPFCTTLAIFDVANGEWTCTFEGQQLICDDYNTTITCELPPIVLDETVICTTETIEDGCPANRECAEVPVIECLD